MRDIHDSETSRVSRLLVANFSVVNLDVGGKKSGSSQARLPRGRSLLVTAARLEMGNRSWIVAGRSHHDPVVCASVQRNRKPKFI